MNRIKTALLAALLAVPVVARAGMDPVTMEIKWNEKTVSVTTTSVGSLTFDIGGFGTTGYAILNDTYTLNGVDGTAYGALSIVSTGTQNVIGSGYTFLAQGATAQLQISQTIKTPPPVALTYPGSAAGSGTFNAGSSFPGSNYFSGPVFSTSSFIIESSGTLITHLFRAKVVNPIFNLSGLSKNATYTLTVDYFVPQAQ